MQGLFAGRGDCLVLYYFSAISSSPPAVDTGASVVTAVWTYVGELAFNLLVLVGAIQGCDRIVKRDYGTIKGGNLEIKIPKRSPRLPRKHLFSGSTRGSYLLGTGGRRGSGHLLCLAAVSEPKKSAGYCILGGPPFAACGFSPYGMAAE